MVSSALLRLLDHPPLLAASELQVRGRVVNPHAPCRVPCPPHHPCPQELLLFEAGCELRQPVRLAALLAWAGLLDSAAEAVATAAAAAAPRTDDTSPLPLALVSGRDWRAAALAAVATLKRLLSPTLALLDSHALAGASGSAAAPYDPHAEVGAAGAFMRGAWRRGMRQ